MALKQLTTALPQVNSVWIFDATGKSLVNSLASPRAGSELCGPRLFLGPRRARASAPTSVPRCRRDSPTRAHPSSASAAGAIDDGSFVGVIQASVLPEYFESFYARIGTRSRHLLRDGARRRRRCWRIPAARSRRGSIRTVRSADIATHPDHGLMTIAWPSDGIERRIGYRRVADYPIYVSAGLETSAIRARWLPP